MADFSRLQRMGYFIITFGWLFLGFCYFGGREFLSDSIYAVLFSSLVMLSFVSCFLEHFFTRPTDVIASTLSILLIMAPLKQGLAKYGIWYEYFMVYTIVMLVMALLSSLFYNDKKPQSSKTSILSNWLKHFSVYFGRAKLLYGTLFILTLLFYIDSSKPEFLWLFATSAFLIIVDPKDFIRKLPKLKVGKSLEVGKIFGVQSKRTFLIKLFKEKDVTVKLFDFVEFCYSMDRNSKPRKGLVIDVYLLNEEQQMKILWSNEIEIFWV